MVAQPSRRRRTGKHSKYDADDGSATVRRVAAALPRDAGVDRITSTVSHDATVWFDGTPADESFFVGEHVDVADVWVSDETGDIAVDVDL